MLDRRKFLTVAGAGAATLSLAACNGASEPAAEDEPADDEPAADEEVAEPVAVRAVALKGPTAMGLVRFMREVDDGNLADNDYSFDIVASPDEVTPLIAKGDVDIAAVPANLASVLYNKTEKGVRAIAINTLGVLYSKLDRPFEIRDQRSRPGLRTVPVKIRIVPENLLQEKHRNEPRVRAELADLFTSIQIKHSTAPVAVKGVTGHGVTDPQGLHPFPVPARRPVILGHGRCAVVLGADDVTGVRNDDVAVKLHWL